MKELENLLKETFPQDKNSILILDGFARKTVVNNDKVVKRGFTLDTYDNKNTYIDRIDYICNYYEKLDDLKEDIKKYNDNKREEEEDKLKYFVNREEDLEKLTSATNSQLTIYKIEAPLGYGKTTLINDKLKSEITEKDFHFYVDFGERDKFTFTLPEFIDYKLNIKEGELFVTNDVTGGDEDAIVYLVFDSVEKLTNENKKELVTYIQENVNHFISEEVNHKLVIIFSGENLGNINIRKSKPIDIILKPFNSHIIQRALELKYDTIKKYSYTKKHLRKVNYNEQILNITGGHPKAILDIISKVLMKGEFFSSANINYFNKNKDKIIKNYVKPNIDSITKKTLSAEITGFEKDTAKIETILKFISVFGFITTSILIAFKNEIELNKDKIEGSIYILNVSERDINSFLIHTHLYKRDVLDRLLYDSISRRLYLNYFKNEKKSIVFKKIVIIAHKVMKSLYDRNKNKETGNKYLYGYIYQNELFNDNIESDKKITSDDIFSDFLEVNKENYLEEGLDISKEQLEKNYIEFSNKIY